MICRGHPITLTALPDKIRPLAMPTRQRMAETQTPAIRPDKLTTINFGEGHPQND
jgi:hypothetical protein